MLVYETSHRGCQSKRTSPTNFRIRTERGLSTISKRSLNIVTSALHIFAPGTRPGSANKAPVINLHILTAIDVLAKDL